MNCPACGAPAAPSDAFCGLCGAPIGGGRQAPPSAKQSHAQQAPPLPPAGFSPLAPPPPPGWPGPGARPGGIPGAPPVRSSFILLIVASAVVVVLLAAAAGVYLLFFRGGGEGVAASTTLAATSTTLTVSSTTQTSALETTTTAVAAGSGGAATAMEALTEQLPQGWISKLVEDGQTAKTYWAGPLNSEWATVFVVQLAEGEGWVVTDSYPFQGGSDVPAGEQEQAAYVVEDFLRAVQEDRADDAHALTIEPFALDPASASYSNGDFLSFSIDGVEPVGDGTYWVLTTEEWRYGAGTWRYRVVPTEAGWMIQDLEPR